MPALRIPTAIEEPPVAGAPDPAPDMTERPAAAGVAAEAPGMLAARVRGHAVARKHAPVSPSAAGDAEPPSGEAPVATPDVTERPATAGPAAEAPGAGNANPPAPTSRVPADPPSPTATATSAPVSTSALSREPAPTIAATEAPAANRVTTGTPTPTVTGADPTASGKPSALSVAAATKEVARGSVARATVARTPTAGETPGRTGTRARTGTPARSRRLSLSRAAVGGPTHPDPRAALSLPPLRVSRRTLPRVERPVGFDTHAGTAARGEAPASRITAGIPGNTRPHVRAHTRVTGQRAPGKAAATVAATATATAPMLAREPEPELTSSQPYHPLANVPDRPSGQSLARAIGVTRERDGSGRSTVVFPQPPGRGMRSGTSVNARPLARRIELEPASLNGHGPDAVPSAAAEPSTYDTGEFEELYDRVLSRLRRDLIVERERRGDLAGAYFR